MAEIHLGDFVNKRLKDIYHEGDGELHLEFENGFKIIAKGIRDPENNFVFKKERIGGETDDELEKARKEKKKALAERREKESKQKNRPKKK